MLITWPKMELGSLTNGFQRHCNRNSLRAKPTGASHTYTHTHKHLEILSWPSEPGRPSMVWRVSHYIHSDPGIVICCQIHICLISFLLMLLLQHVSIWIKPHSTTISLSLDEDIDARFQKDAANCYQMLLSLMACSTFPPSTSEFWALYKDERIDYTHITIISWIYLIHLDSIRS